METLEEQTGLVADGVGDDLALGKLVGDRRTDQGCIHLQQLLGQPGERLDRQSAMALVRGGLEREGDACPDALRRGLLHAELGRNGIGGLEADPAHILGQPVWVLGHDLNGLIAVGLEDAHRPSRADAMGMQEDHDLPHRLLLGPAGDDAGGPHRADARNLGQTLRIGLDDLEGVLAKGCHDALGHGWADAAHLA